MKKRVTLMVYLLVFVIQLSSAEANNNMLYRIRSKGLWGYIDSSGIVTIRPQYQYASAWIDNYAVVSSNGHEYGIIDNVGQIILPMNYHIEWKENQHILVVYSMGSMTDDNACGIFNTENGYYSGLCWKNARIPNENSRYVLVQSLSRLWGYVDSMTGKEIIPCQFSYAENFQENWAGIRFSERQDNMFYFDALVNTCGEYLYPPQGVCISFQDGVSDGLIQVIDQGTGLTGYMNVEGQVEIEPKWIRGFSFNHGFAVVQKDFERTYLIDKKGMVLNCNILPPDPGDDDNNVFCNGMMTVFLSVGSNNSEQIALLTTEGDIVDVTTDHGIIWIFHFCDYSAAWYLGPNSRYGLINRQGEIITDAVFQCTNTNGSVFINGLAACSIEGKWGYIDIHGEWIIPPLWDKAYPFCGNLAMVENNGMIYYINPMGTIVWREETVLSKV